MTKARNIADLLDANGDVKTSSLDNVPASNDASALTTGTLPDARLSNQVKVVKSGSAPSNPQEGDLWYDTTNDVLKVYDATDSSFVKVVRVTPTLDSISGNIVNTTAGNLTLTGTGFLTSGLIVSFTPSGGSASTVTVTPTNDTTATVAIPSAIYGQSASTVIGIKVTNSDVKISNTVNKTVITLPTGGTITNSGGYTYHKFTSSGTFTNTIASLSVEYLIIAGGGGASGGDYSTGGGGGGAGGLRNGTISANATGYSVVIGAGGTGAAGMTNTSPPVGIRASQAGSSSILGVTSIGGGAGGAYQNLAAQTGGSGGGGSYNPHTAGASGTTGQGNDGGNGTNDRTGGGGGGAGGDGGNASDSSGGHGGVGSNTYSAWATATSSGANSGYYAGGGGGGASDWTDAPSGGRNAGNGGLGGGGAGGHSVSQNNAVKGTDGTANTGGGAGGSALNTNASSLVGANGGSGIVIVRYQI